MAWEVCGWAAAINVILFIRIVLRAPFYMKHVTEFERINADVKMIYAQIALEEHNLKMKEAPCDLPSGS